MHKSFLAAVPAVLFPPNRDMSYTVGYTVPDKNGVPANQRHHHVGGNTLENGAAPDLFREKVNAKHPIRSVLPAHATVPQ